MAVSLVTGGAGFIGSHLAQALHAHGHKVVVVDNLSGGWVHNVPLSAQFVNVDLATEDVDRVVRLYKPDYIWHLAAYAAEGLSHWVREFNYLNNTVASAKLITAAVKYGVEHFYFTSSMAVYGSQTPPFTESMWPAPEDPYGIAKFSVEQDLAVAHRMHGLNYTIFRPHNVYGPNQNIGDPYRNVIGIWMRQALEGLPLTVYGTGSQTRAFSYITDIVDPMVAALDVGMYDGLTFNIGGEQVVTIADLAERVSHLTGAPIQNLPRRVEVEHAWCDHTAAKSYLGFAPKVALAEGLNHMWLWAQRAGVRRSATPTLEHAVDLPPFWQLKSEESNWNPSANGCSCSSPSSETSTALTV
jgi:UDP-glucose 4-epimerase